MKCLSALNAKRVQALFQLRKLLGVRRIIEVQGYIYEVDAKYSLDLALLTLRGFEPDLVMAIEVAKAIGGSGGYIDIGANAGYWAIPMAENFSSSMAFEPDSGARARLMRNLSLNSLENLVVSDLAVSDSSGIARFAIRRALDNSGSLNDGLGSLVNFETFLEDTVLVETVSLDDYLPINGFLPGFMKIDVEGAEEMVLLGASRTISEARPVVVAEILFPHNSERMHLLSSRLNLFPKSYFHFMVQKSKLKNIKAVSGADLLDMNIFSVPEEQLHKLANWLA